MRHLLSTLLFLGCCLQVTFIHAGNGATFFKGDRDLKKSMSEGKEAEYWATCSASFKATSDIYAKLAKTDVHRAQVKEVANSGNGAYIAAVMSQVMPKLESSIENGSFPSLWKFSSSFADSMVETTSDYINTEFQFALASKTFEAFNKRLMATNKYCFSTVDTQQVYIDFWREIAKSGLLAAP